jgi:hypothetical protein
MPGSIQRSQGVELEKVPLVHSPPTWQRRWSGSVLASIFITFLVSMGNFVVYFSLSFGVENFYPWAYWFDFSFLNI